MTSPTLTWGASTRVTVRGAPGAKPQYSAQLIQMSLPEPAVCTAYLQASFLSASSPSINVGVYTVNLLMGLGRVTVPRTVSFAGQPSSAGPLEFTIDLIPLNALQVDLLITPGGALATDPAQSFELETYMVLSPVTRIPMPVQEGQPFRFGMDLPGEADGLDDAALEDSEMEPAPARKSVSMKVIRERNPELSPQKLRALVRGLRARGYEIMR